MSPTAITVVIPVYNRQDGAARAVQSALEQRVEDLEIVLVDDGSAPPFVPTPAFKDDPRVRLVRHDTNRGAAAARNTGMASARGTWVAFLDSDDWWLPGTLAPRFAAAREAAAVGEDPLVVHVAGFKMVRLSGQSSEVRIPVSSSNPLDFASGCWFSPGSTALFRPEVILKTVGGLDERLRRFEDVDWFLRIALAGGRIVTDPIIAAVINIGPRPSPDTVERNSAAVLQNFAKAMAGSAMLSEIMRRLRAWAALELASARWYSAHRWLAIASLLRSWWWVPRLRLQVVDCWEQKYAATGGEAG